MLRPELKGARNPPVTGLHWRWLYKVDLVAVWAAPQSSHEPGESWNGDLTHGARGLQAR